MSKTAKIFSVSIVVLVVVVLVVGIQLKNYIDVDKIRESIVLNLEQNFPGSAVKVGVIDFKIAPKVKVRIEDLTWKVESTSMPLVRMEDIEVQFDFLSLIMPSGKTTVTFNNAEIQSQTEVWKQVYPTSKFNVLISKVEVPHFLMTNKLNLVLNQPQLLSAKNIVESLQVRKMVFKNITREKRPAFEIQFGDLPIPLTKETIHVDTRLVGAVDFPKLLNDRILSSEGTAFFRTHEKGLNNTIQSTFKFVGNTIDYTVLFNFVGSEKISGEARVRRTAEGLSVQAEKLRLSGKTFWGERWAESSSDVLFEVSSTLVLDQTNRKLDGHITGQSVSDIPHTWFDMPATTKLSFKWDRQKLVYTSESRFEKGEISSRSEVLHGLGQLLFNQELDIDREWESEVNAEGIQYKSLRGIGDLELIPAWLRNSSYGGKVKFEGKMLLVEDQKFSFSSDVIFKQNNLLKGSYRFSAGQGFMDYSWSSEKPSNIKLVNFDLNLLNTLLPSEYKRLQGTASGRGVWSINQGLITDGKFSFEVLRGKWLKNALHQLVLRKIEKTQDVDPRGVPNEFDHLVLKGNMQASNLSIEKFSYSLLNAYQLNVSGSVDTIKDLGKMKGQLSLEKASESLIKFLGGKDLNFLMTKLDQSAIELEGVK